MSVDGRPFRVAEMRRAVANVAGGDGWGYERFASRALGTSVLDADRATRWARVALDEHASIGAFSRLSLQLLGAGAPARLVRGTHRAALDEVRHAELCFALASRYAGVPLRPSALHLPPAIDATCDLATVAVESLLDGAVNEGLAAAAARASLPTAVDDEERDALRIIARDEARHAKLAEQIVAWCVDEGGARVADALLAALARVDGVSAPAGLDAQAAQRVRRRVVNRVRALVTGRGSAIGA